MLIVPPTTSQQIPWYANGEYFKTICYYQLDVIIIVRTKFSVYSKIVFLVSYCYNHHHHIGRCNYYNYSYQYSYKS